MKAGPADVRTKPIKVLQLQPDFNVKTHAFADLAEQIVIGLQPRRFTVVSAYLRGKPEAGDPVSRASRSVYFEFSDRELKGARLKALWTLFKFCRAEQFDVIVCNRFKPISMMLILSRWLPKAGYIGIIHGFGDFDRKYRLGQVRRLGSTSWCFVGVSEAVRLHLLGYKSGFTESNTITITNAIDTLSATKLQLSRAAARQELGLPDDVLLIGAIGRLVPVKAHTLLVEALAALKPRYPALHLVIIGEGRERDTLEALADDLQVSRSLHLPGFVPDALRYAKAFDVFAMPSLSEGLGLALLEAMSARLPLVASQVPAMHPLLIGAGGKAVAVGNLESLISALEDYLRLNETERERAGEAAFNYLNRNHSVEKYRAAYRDLIEKMADQSAIDE
ncbi:glycosyltransferase [Halopseudomonas nanhaiensis]|uniref:glycosyltransferase n=1 Tax=Halopseudomonas nanhaiensis TaxID=2830842 RepID=UPI001CBE88C7|nr:glycosyltransferase [Halopseudomonas nanhaiensis]UAW99096.1 glycosyltransferase [Halopseudomonas nanhaiensis]